MLEWHVCRAKVAQKNLAFELRHFLGEMLQNVPEVLRPFVFDGSNRLILANRFDVSGVQELNPFFANCASGS